MRRITLVAAALCVAAASAPLLADEDSQGFLRVVEGAATLIRVEDGQPEAARENTPALAGDRLSLAPGSRVEVILPDGHRLRLAESADLELVALARSLDEDSAATALQLSNGALAIDVPLEAFDRTRVDTEAASVLLERGGLYLVEIDQRGSTRVVVREGEA
ncbi:MAG TPA: FecR domain-containing protein, partial [Thermoanaerobaculia bacterium]|nr:FecR domain-containing protein [Thermoanaerobaculia bacterium]